MKLLSSQEGMTLLELMLVLAISGAILVSGLNLYQSFMVDVNAQQLKYNVDVLFQGLANYYKSNCIQYINQSGTLTKSGTLDPDTGSIKNPFPIDPAADLSSAGYLAAPYPFVQNPLVAAPPTVDPTNPSPPAPNPNYVTQFNLVYIPGTVNEPQRVINMSSGTQWSAGNIVLWKAQVAVQLSTAAAKSAQAYKGMLGADCVSTYDASSNSVTPCETAQGGTAQTGTYLVWERLPSFASPETVSDVWPSMPTVTQFTQMYTTYPISLLINGQTQNYLCGG